jgi:hypothetical protein
VYEALSYIRSLEYIGRLCPALMSLDVTGCVSLTDDGISHVSATYAHVCSRMLTYADVC